MSTEDIGAFGLSAERAPPRSPKARSVAAAMYAKPDDICENPKCKEMRRVERTMVSNLKQEVATLKMQISQLMQQRQRKTDEADESADKSGSLDAEVNALRVALTEEAHAHGVAIAESSTKLAALKLKLSVREREIVLEREKLERERERVRTTVTTTKTLHTTIAELEEELASRDEAIAGLQVRKRADRVDVSKPEASVELRETALKVRKEAEEVQARLQARVEAVEARAEGLRALSIKQASALGLASLSERQAAKEVEKAKASIAQIREKHRVEIEQKRRATVLFTTLCAQQVLRAKATAERLRTRVTQLEEEQRALEQERENWDEEHTKERAGWSAERKAITDERRAWLDVQATLAAQRAEAELRAKEADARVAELEAKRAVATEQATALATVVAVVSQKQKATASKLQDVEEARAASQTALEGAMAEVSAMAGEIVTLQESVSTQMRVMGEALEHRDATGEMVQVRAARKAERGAPGPGRGRMRRRTRSHGPAILSPVHRHFAPRRVPFRAARLSRAIRLLARPPACSCSRLARLPIRRRCSALRSAGCRPSSALSGSW
jgi:chromosome segregation ATPase